MQTATQARALAHYSAMAQQAACWASQAEAAHAAALGRDDDEAAALERVADDAADEYLIGEGELLLHIADDTPRGHKLRRYHEAWQGSQLRDGLTCEEIVEACIWAPAGADLKQAMYVLRERLRQIAHTKYAASVEQIARRMVAEGCEQ